jgi:hypothetical protein
MKLNCVTHRMFKELLAQELILPVETPTEPQWKTNLVLFENVDQWHKKKLLLFASP